MATIRAFYCNSPISMYVSGALSISDNTVQEQGAAQWVTTLGSV